MVGNLNTRKLPTLTEIVEPAAIAPLTAPQEASVTPAASAVNESLLKRDVQGGAGQRGGLGSDRDALAAAVIRQIGPRLELELRRSAHALLDVQLTALLPDLHLRIEEMVRQSIQAGGESEQP